MEGSEYCSGSCEDGWKGRFCDVPEVSQKQMENMRHGRGDYNQDGMYKPKAGEDWGGNDNSYDSPIRRPQSEPSSGSSTMMRSGGHRAKRIDDTWEANTNLNQRPQQPTNNFVQESSG